MDRRQGETKRAGGGFGLSKPHKELLLPLRADADDTGYGKEEEMLLVSTAEAAAAGYRAAEGSSSRGIGGGVEDDKKRRLTPPFTSPPSSSLYASPAAARRGGVASTVAATGGGLGATTAASGVPASSQPCCQAERCTADLTEAKRYHRRHKVCETHSKAPVVAVAGLRQRFCQQCSRFHELSEFDDTKRSCRRRLAGHNERRRKSSADSQEEGPNSRCRQTDHNRKIQITMPGAAAATPAYKHFQIR